MIFLGDSAVAAKDYVVDVAYNAGEAAKNAAIAAKDKVVGLADLSKQTFFFVQK